MKKKLIISILVVIGVVVLGVLSASLINKFQKNGDKITLVWDSLNKTKVDDSYFYFDTTKYPNVEVNDLR